MSNIDLSLDDIIKKKRTGGFRANRNQGRGGASTKFIGARPGIGSRLSRPNMKQNTLRQVPDARLKIIVNQRAKLKDARDRLNSIAKMTDARQKLQKLKAARNVQLGRQIQGGGGLITRGGNNQGMNQRPNQRYQSPLSIINKHVLSRNKSASPNSKLLAESQLTRTVPGNRLSGRLGAFRQLSSSSTGPLTSSNLRSAAANANKRVVVGSSGIRITTANDDVHASTGISTGTGRYLQARPVMNAGNVVVASPNTALKRNFDDDEPDDDEEEDEEDVPMDEDLEHVSIGRLPDFKRLKSTAVQSSVSGSTTLSRINARLQSRLSTTDSVSPLQGYKVTVSNLQPSVTQDDILELFNEIGALRKASLVKRGLAEVVFFKSSDAQKACEAYHNRQLDGKPMCVTLVTPIPPGMQTKSSAASSPWLRVGGLRSDYMSASSSPSAIPRNRISPDIEIIRKALFHKSLAAV